MYRRIFFCLSIFYSTSFLGEEQQTICLNMIVKNEAAVIERCLESTLPLIDTWIIVDTGSTDGTQQIIQDFFRKNNKTGELYERPWISFGHNREEALQLAKDRADYILFIDADDKLVFAPGFKKPILTKDFYSFHAQTKGHAYSRVDLIKSNLSWHWYGRIHEYIIADRKTEGCMLEGIEYHYLNDGARSKDPTTYQKDLALLLEDLKDNPNNSRTYFYLGKTYLLLGKLEEALAAFQKRGEMAGWEEEIFAAKFSVAQIQDRLGKETATVMQSFKEAFLTRPHRTEPLYYIAEKLMEEKRHEQAYHITKAALDLPKRNQDLLFQEHWIPDYGIPLQNALCAAHTKRYSEGLKMCQFLLHLEGLPEEVTKKVQNCQAYIYQEHVKTLPEKLNQIVFPEEAVAK